MFLLEAFALSVAARSAAHPKNSYGALLKRFADRIQGQLGVVRKTSYAASSTDKLISECQKDLKSLRDLHQP